MLKKYNSINFDTTGGQHLFKNTWCFLVLKRGMQYRFREYQTNRRISMTRFIQQSNNSWSLKGSIEEGGAQEFT